MAYTIAERVAFWDLALECVRRTLRVNGMCEVSTPCRMSAAAIEPFIEPIAAGGKWLMTSPELPMKRLVSLGAGAIFQVAHVFRGGEHGPRHREEFHLIEWYRPQSSLATIMSDVERLVADVGQALAAVAPCDRALPQRWRREGFLDLYRHLRGRSLRGDESAGELQSELTELRTQLGISSQAVPFVHPSGGRTRSEESEQLGAWTELFTLWSELELDSWLREIPRSQGLHVVDFPGPLAALSCLRDRTALRFESYWGGAELGNAYQELADATEQQRRFEWVNELRCDHGWAELPLPVDFLAALSARGLPAETCGAAMGFERLLSTVLDADFDAIVFDL